jgi:hypothetical protein
MKLLRESLWRDLCGKTHAGTAAIGCPSSAARSLTPQPIPNHASQTTPAAPPVTAPSSHEYPESANKYCQSSPANSAPAPAPDSSKYEPFPAEQKPQPPLPPPPHPSPPERTAYLRALTTPHHHCGADAAERSNAADPAAHPHPSTRRPRNSRPPSPPHFPPAEEQSSGNPGSRQPSNFS